MELVSFRWIRGPGIEMDREDPPARRRVPPVLPIPVPFFAVVRHRAVSEQPNIALPFVPPDVGEGMGNLVIDLRMRNIRFFDIRRQQMSGKGAPSVERAPSVQRAPFDSSIFDYPANKKDLSRKLLTFCRMFVRCLPLL